MIKYKYSGHGTFPCRYTWLPKAVIALKDKPNLFGDVDEAMVELGVGKQMVRAIRFWVEAAKVAKKKNNNDFEVTLLGERLMGKDGLDPFLEDSQTLWLIHWNFSTHRENPLFAWDFLMNQWQEPEIVPSLIVRAFEKESEVHGKKRSLVTLREHFDVFLHTYLPTRGTKGDILEDNLDCPLIELELIRQIGERRLHDGKREPVYAFNQDPKPQISQELFAFCLNDFWEIYQSEEDTLLFREIAYGHDSPGQIFKLPEQEIRDRLEKIQDFTEGAMTFRESVNARQVQKHRAVKWETLLDAIYT